jgi:hypothetical protein
VSLHNALINATREQSTNGEGLYALPDLAPGSYVLTVHFTSGRNRFRCSLPLLGQGANPGAASNPANGGTGLNYFADSGCRLLPVPSHIAVFRLSK